MKNVLTIMETEGSWYGIFNYTIKKIEFLNMTSEYVFPFLFISLFVSFGVCIYVICLFNALRIQTLNKKYLLELITRTSRVRQINVPCERTLNLDL